MAHRKMETFLTVARVKTLKAAAGILHLAQSTVSKRLQLLEQEYGIILFDRGKGGKEATLTPDGERFVGIAERFLDLAHEAKKLGAQQARLRFSIAAAASMNAIIFPQLYSRLLESEPRMRLSVTTLRPAEMYDEVDARRSDVAFSFLERAHSNVSVRPCFSEPMLVVSFSGEEGAEMETVALDSLDPEREVCFPWTPAHQVWRSARRPTGPPRMAVDDPHLLAALLRRQNLWALAPLSAALHFQRQGGCRLFRLLPDPPERICYELTHKNPRSQVSEALATVRRHMRAVLTQEFGIGIL